MMFMRCLMLRKKAKEDPAVDSESKKKIRAAYSSFIENKERMKFEQGHELLSGAIKEIEALGDNHELVRPMLASLSPAQREMFYTTNTNGERVFTFPAHLMQAVAYAGEQAYRRKNQFNEMKGYTDDILVV